MLVILLIVLVIFLVLVDAFRPNVSQLSTFEIKRRLNEGNRDSKLLLEKQLAAESVWSLKRLVCAITLIFVFLISVLEFGYLIGTIISLVIVFIYSILSNTKPVKLIAKFIYNRFEVAIINIAESLKFILELMANCRESLNDELDPIGSREELQHLIKNSNNVLTADEKSLITNGLSLKYTLVDKIMTPRSKIIAVGKSDFLGPLSLHDLHAKGHTQLPVINQDLDHIIGMIDIKNLLTLDVKKSTTVEKAMNPKVYYIRGDQNITVALETFVNTHSSIIIVINKSRETVGILSLADVVRTLFSRDLNSDFDSYDNPRDVSARKNS